jgi:hypothetical protein
VNRLQGFRSVARFGNMAARKGFGQYFDDSSPDERVIVDD